MKKKKIIELISNLLFRLINKNTKVLVMEDRIKTILDLCYEYFLERLKLDIKNNKLKI